MIPKQKGLIKPTLSNKKIVALGISILMLLTAVIAGGGLAKLISPSDAEAASGSVNFSVGKEVFYSKWSTNYMYANGILAYCAEPAKETPNDGSYSIGNLYTLVSSSGSQHSVDELASAIYYGYGGPGFDASAWPISTYYDGTPLTDDDYLVITHIVIADIFTSNGSEALYKMSSSAQTWFKNNVLSYYGGSGTVQAYLMQGAPSGFADSCYTIYSGSDNQVIVSYVPQGYIDLQKVSATPGITDNNPNYVLGGAQYGIYSDSGCTNLVGTLVTDANGYASSSALTIGTYYVKEINASVGYSLDSNIYTVEVGSYQTTRVNASTVPETEYSLASLQVDKRNKETGSNSGISGLSLAGAVYKINYYQVSTGTDVTGVSPTRTWYVTTDENGYADLNSIASNQTITVTKEIRGSNREYSYTNSETYTKDGENVIPLGVITIQEVLAPTGYLLDNGTETSGELRTLNITPGSATSTIYFTDGQTVQSADPIYRSDLTLSKQEAITETPIANTVFVIESKTTGEWHAVVTDASGIVSTETEWNPHSDNTNGNDAAVTKNADGTYTVTDESLLDSTYGVWFTGYANEDTTWNADGTYTVTGAVNQNIEVDDASGALPYGDYVVKELRCTANSGLSLADEINVEIKRNDYTYDIGTIKDYAINLSTTAIDTTTYSSVGLTNDGNVSIKDVVTYSNVTTGSQYVLTGVLTDKDTGEPLKDASGTTISSTKTFTADDKNGEVEMTLTVDSDLVSGKAVTVFEYLYENDVLVAEHTTVGDETQTVYYPKVLTSAFDSVTTTKEGTTVVDKEINDVISYSGVKIGLQYIVKGYLVDASTGNPILDDNGNAVTSETSFMATTEEGTINMSFSVPTTFDVAGRSITVCEEIYYNHILVGQHNKVADINQSIKHALLSTTALDATTSTHEGLASGTITINDTVSYDNLTNGTTYTLVATLMDRETGDKVTDTYGNAITATKTFTASGSSYGAETLNGVSGKIVNTITVDSSIVEGRELVVYEDLYLGTTPTTKTYLAEHSNLEDDSQSVYYPKISTSAIDTQTNAHEGSTSDTRTITDTISYENLENGAAYTAQMSLMDASTGKTLTDANGNELTVSSVFVAGDSSSSGVQSNRCDGATQVSIDVDLQVLSGKSIVVYEKVYRGNTTNGTPLVAAHTDLDDAEQTIHYPEIGTTATDGITGEDEGLASGTVTINDVVAFTNLEANGTYQLTATLMDKETGEAITTSSGAPVTASTSFTATGTTSKSGGAGRVDGTATVVLSVDADAVIGKATVVFETLTHIDLKQVDDNTTNVEVAYHNDLNDDGQSVYYPLIGTTALDSLTGIHESNANGNNIQIIDTVAYKNLEANATYTISGYIVDKETGKTITNDNGNDIVASSTFTTGAATDSVGRTDGTATVKFKIDDIDLNGKTVIVYEQLYKGGSTSKMLVAEHKDIDDIQQSIYFPLLHTNAYDSITLHDEGLATDDNTVTIIDDVSYENLEQGATYTLVGILMDKATGKALTDADSNVITNTRTFVAGEDYSSEYLTKQDTTTDDVVSDVINTSLDIISSITQTSTSTSSANDVNSFADRISGNVPLSFDVDGEIASDKSIVVYETIYYGDTQDEDKIVGTHEDIDDEEQTVHYPLIGTTASFEATSTKEGHASGEQVINDVVAYENLEDGANYKLTATLMNKETGEIATDVDGNQVSAVLEFIAGEGDGSTINDNERIDGEVVVSIAFLADDFGGEYVVFEELERINEDETYDIAEHKDIDDYAQSIYFPVIHTTAIDEESQQHEAIMASERTIVDTIAYSYLENGAIYTAVGYLVDAESGEEITDAAGNVIIASTEFVAGETISDEDAATNDDSSSNSSEQENDNNNSTTADNANSNTNSNSNENANVNANTANANTNANTDTDSNSNTNSDSERTSSINDEKTDDDSTGPSAFDFADGEVTVNLTFDSELLESGSGIVVVFENVYHCSQDEFDSIPSNDEEQLNTKLIASHLDLSDESQRVYYPTLGTEATVDGSHETHAMEDLTIIDKVSYTNLEIGATYRVEGVLMNKATGEEIIDANGDIVTASTEFTPNTTSGDIDVMFNFNATTNEWTDSVVFEKLYKVETNDDETDLLVGTHEDLNDASQTIAIKDLLVADDLIMFTPLTQTSDYLPIIALIMIGAGSAVSIIVLRNKRNNKIK